MVWAKWRGHSVRTDLAEVNGGAGPTQRAWECRAELGRAGWRSGPLCTKVICSCQSTSSRLLAAKRNAGCVFVWGRGGGAWGRKSIEGETELVQGESLVSIKHEMLKVGSK